MENNNNEILAVKFNAELIKYIDNPSEAVQLEAVKQKAFTTEYIDDSTETAQLEAVKTCGGLIKYIKNPSESVQLEAVKQDSFTIKHIKTPTETVQLEAVKKCEYAIEYIANPSEAVQIEAVKKHFVRQNPNQDTTDGLSLEMPEWRMNIRASNTEPLLRLNIETRANPQLVNDLVAEVEQIIESV